MIKSLFQRFRDKPPAEQPQQQGPFRRRLQSREMPAAVYAIGDIHGCHHLQVRLEAAIAEDAADIKGSIWIVHLGDQIDRGPASAAVMRQMMAPMAPGFRRVCLAGNHEEIAWDFLYNKNYGNGWLDFGGRETLASYGLYDPDPQSSGFEQRLAAHVPAEHIDFLGSLPAMLVVPGYCFVHAGIDPAVSLADQTDRVLLWSRPSDFTWPKADSGICVVHGHTPVAAPYMSESRINIDLGAYATGRLGAVKMTPDREPSILVIES